MTTLYATGFSHDTDDKITSFLWTEYKRFLVCRSIIMNFPDMNFPEVQIILFVCFFTYNLLLDLKQ